MDYDELFKILPKEPKRWNKNDIQIWLQHIGLETLSPIFQQHAIDGAFLDVLSEDDLNEIGIEQSLKRKKLLQWISIGLKEYHQYVKQKNGPNQWDLPQTPGQHSQGSIQNDQISLEQPIQEVQKDFIPVQLPINQTQEEEQKFVQHEADQLYNDFQMNASMDKQKRQQYQIIMRKSSMIESFKQSLEQPKDIVQQKQKLKLVNEITKETIFIDSDIIFTIGRNPENNLVLPHDHISRLHCQIFYSNESFYLKDCGSSSGSFVQLTTPALLKQGLILEMGSSQFLLESIKQTQDRTHIQVLMSCIFGLFVKQKFKFELAKDSISLIFGRLLTQFQNDTRLSQNHAQFFAIDEGLVIEDMSSLNGTWLRLSEASKASDPIKIINERRVRLSIDKFFTCFI